MCYIGLLSSWPTFVSVDAVPGGLGGCLNIRLAGNSEMRREARGVGKGKTMDPPELVAGLYCCRLRGMGLPHSCGLVVHVAVCPDDSIQQLNQTAPRAPIILWTRGTVGTTLFPAYRVPLRWLPSSVPSLSPMWTADTCLHHYADFTCFISPVLTVWGGPRSLIQFPQVFVFVENTFFILCRLN